MGAYARALSAWQASSVMPSEPVKTSGPPVPCPGCCHPARGRPPSVRCRRQRTRGGGVAARRRTSRPVSRVLWHGPLGNPRRRPSLSGWRCRQPPAVHPQARAGSPRTPAQAALPDRPLDLAPGGVYRAARVTPGAGALLPHPFTLAPPRVPARRGGLLSVALSRGSPRVAVNNHPALWSPDFPRRDTGPSRYRHPTRPPGRLVRRRAMVERQSPLRPPPIPTLREAVP